MIEQLEELEEIDDPDFSWFKKIWLSGRLCRDFQNGKCSYTNCKFSHDILRNPTTNQPGSTAALPASMATEIGPGSARPKEDLSASDVVDISCRSQIAPNCETNFKASPSFWNAIKNDKGESFEIPKSCTTCRRFAKVNSSSMVTSFPDALGLERNTMSICYEPMAEGCANGPRSKVVANTRRKQAWTQWAERLIKSNGAPCNNAIDEIPNTLPSAVHVFVWYGDAAIKGTSRPAMGAYSHSLYWVFYLSGRHTKHLHISALEFLTIIGQLIIFGNKMPMPSGTCKYQILVQSDSLNATMDLTEKAKKSPIMQYIHEKMLQRPEYQKLKDVLQAGHIWGEGNSITDDLSRGDLQLAMDTCTMLGVKPKELPVPSTFTQLVNNCVEKAISLGASKRQ